MASLASTLFANAANWVDHAPHYAALNNAFGGGAAANHGKVSRGMVNLATQSPVAIVFMLTGRPNKICVGHSPTHCPADPLAAHQHNNEVAFQLGNCLGAAINITLPDAAWQCTGNINALD